jgi:hypothetical protein
MSLSDYFRSQAEWRQAKADDYPDDARNQQSADALHALADYAEADSSVNALVPHLFEDINLGGEETRRAVARYGFGYRVTPTHHEEFVEELGVLCLIDAYDFASEQSGSDPTGTLLSFELDAAQHRVHLPRQYWERRSHSAEYELADAVGAYSTEASDV